MEKLSPEDALRVLDQAAGFYKGSRQEHQTLVTAVVTLKDFIEKNSSVPAPVIDRVRNVEIHPNGDE